MGPPAPTPKRDAAAHSRTDALRTRERRSAPSGQAHAGGESSASFATAPVEQVEWASPTSLRARSRPSNLHSYLWSNGSFPLSAAASPRPVRRSGGSMSSGGSTGVASPRQSRPGRSRSQSTRATQTSATDFFISSQEDDSPATISLGVYGDISRMGMDTVNYLIQALEERRHDLLQEEKAPPRTRDAALNPQACCFAMLHYSWAITILTMLACWKKQAESTKRAGSRQVNPGTGTNDGAVHGAQPPDGDGASSAEEAVERGRVRSRSYEALAKLEQILEARHQQLMQDGALDGTAGLSLHGSAGSDLTEEIRKLQQSFLQEARRHL